MKRFSKPLFLIGFSIACIAFIASGLFFAQASDRVKGKVPKKGATQIKTTAAPAGGAILVEDFPYETGDLATVGAGTGWVVHSGGTTNPINAVSPGLTYSGYAGSDIGNAVSTVATGIDMSRQFSAVGSGSLYTSFMVNVSNSTTTGDYIFHYLTFGSTAFFRGRVFVRKDAETTNFAFGLSRASGDVAYTGTSYTPNTTYLVVLKYTFVDGVTNDTVELFVDPTPGAAEPAATLSAPADLSNGDPANLDAIALRQGGTTSGSTQTLDGIRVATTWADAVALGGGPTPTPHANVDMNGDGRTDFVITREIGSFATSAFELERRRSMREQKGWQLRQSEANAPAGSIPIEWWGVNNGAPGGTNAVWGDSGSGDNVISADFDGDGSDDIAIWRPGPPEQAAFYSINSSDLTYRVDAFGQSGDSAIVVGDYDGDGIDDSATFRCPPTGSGAGQCYFFYRGSLNNPTNGITYIPWGFGETIDYFPLPGDFDGDGKHDFCLQATNPNAPLQAILWLQLNDANYTQETIYWGYSTDFLIPGDFDGDGKSDFCVMRSEGGRLIFYILHRTGAIRAEQWGLATDFPVPGDYDGDGTTDIAIYRWNQVANTATYWILPSNGDPHWTFEFGIPGDVPVAHWNVN